MGYGIGPKKMSEHFCYIAFHKDHVNLGFNQGAPLPDPEGLLEGPGKTLRHVKVAEPEDLEDPALRRLSEVAKAHRVSTRSVGRSLPDHRSHPHYSCHAYPSVLERGYTASSEALFSAHLGEYATVCRVLPCTQTKCDHTQLGRW